LADHVPDALDRVCKYLGEIIWLLSSEIVNHVRLTSVLAANNLLTDEGASADRSADLGKTSHKLCELIELLGKIQWAARVAHVPPPGPGRPSKTRNLYDLARCMHDPGE